MPGAGYWICIWIVLATAGFGTGDPDFNDGTESNTYWETKQILYITQVFNYSDAQEIITDLKNDALDFDAKHNTAEAFFVEKIEKEFRNIGWQLQYISNNRKKRNVFGNVIASLTGLITADQMRIEHQAVIEANNKIKSILNHEIELEELLKNMTHGTMSKTEILRMMGVMHRSSLNDAKYQSRKVNI